MTKFNANQLRAIELKHKNIMVSASAGSGKTTVLIERLMRRVVQDRVPIDAILAMTFTEAAANEMKKRLATSLQQALAKSQNEEEQAYISKQLTQIQTAHISTIHSFCLSIIKEYYYMIGLNPQRITNILDGSTMLMYQKQALDFAFEEQYQKQDPIFTNLCMMFSARNENDEALSKLITSLATLASSQPNSNLWLDSLVNPYQNFASIQDLPDAIKEQFFDYLNIQYMRYKECLTQLEQLYFERYPDQEKKYAVVKNKLEVLATLEPYLETQDYTQFRLGIQNVCHAIVPTSPEKTDNEYKALRAQAQDMENDLLAQLFSEHQFLKDLFDLQPYVLKVIEMVKDYRDAYNAIKEEECVIDFDDMEHYALAILQCQNHAIANRYREQFQEIMVDEFQDSNDIQNELVKLIARKDNVFRVGDVKQSIYKFRHAKPQLMRGIIDEAGEFDDTIYLYNNYRSKKMVVDFNNILFEHLMNLDGFSCHFDQYDNAEIGIPAQEEDNRPICFHALFNQDINEETTYSKNELKARYITHQIISIREKENRKWKDFVVLTRDNAKKEHMKKIFDEYHVPYFIDVKSGFYQSPAVQTVLSTMKACLYPNDDIAFLATMTSALFQCSFKQFADIKIAKRQRAQQQTQETQEKVYECSYYEYFKQHPTPEFERFLALKQACMSQTVTCTLNQIFNQNQYYTLYTSMQDRTNLDLLFEKAVAFEQQSSSGIHAFLNKVEQIKDTQTAEAIPIGSEADVVRVMSIHQSKGLQFPVVFLWSTDKMSDIEFNDFCIGDSELGIAFKHMDLPQRYVRPTIPRLAMEHKINKENLEEEMRILYVATTRAQQQMHIVDCIKSIEPYFAPLTTGAVYNKNGYTSWILQYFLNHSCDLFKTIEVHQLWETEALPVETSWNEPLKSYDYDTKEYQFITASNAAHKQEELILTKQVGAQYGRKMHKMVELLNNQEWTTETIKQYARKIDFNIYQKDILRLQHLHENNLFKDALEGQCYYELPFIVEKKEEILHGFMDFVSMKEQDILIVDFKTDALEESNDFITRYQEQLSLYKQALTILYPTKHIHTKIYSFHLEAFINIP